MSERPAHIEGRQQVGHWDCETVIGVNQKQAIVTAVERKSGYAVTAKVSKKQLTIKTLTEDNGKELWGHALIDKALKSTGYFARPFASWEPGTNENFNGLLRQYFPKKRPMKNINDEKIKMIENRLNNRTVND